MVKKSESSQPASGHTTLPLEVPPTGVTAEQMGEDD